MSGNSSVRLLESFFQEFDQNLAGEKKIVR